MSGQRLTCQRALVNTAYAEDAGTRSALTFTTTATGSSRAALMIVSRSGRYVVVSRTPSARRTVTPSRAAWRT
jgi:hypothetical protein